MKTQIGTEREKFMNFSVALKKISSAFKKKQNEKQKLKIKFEIEKKEKNKKINKK